MNYKFKGVDISKFQPDGSVDFKKLKSDRYEFAILRAGYGRFLSQKDTAFESHYKKAKAAGLKVGAYHYTYAKTVDEAKQEADCFLTWIKGKELEYPVALNMEDKSIQNLGKNKLTDIAYTFMEKVEKAGYYTMLYTNPDWLKYRLDYERLKRFDIWLACWTSEKRRDELWDKPFGIWQYGLDPKFKIDGDYAYKDYAGIIRRNNLNNL